MTHALLWWCHIFDDLDHRVSDDLFTLVELYASISGALVGAITRLNSTTTRTFPSLRLNRIELVVRTEVLHVVRIRWML